MYPWLVFLHVIGVFGFLMAHGVSAGVYFGLHRERNLERVRLLLQMSSGTVRVMGGSLLLLLVTGIIAGFMGQWWSRGWIWLSLILLVVLYFAMAGLGTRTLNEVRQGVGLPSAYGQPPRSEMLSPDELDALLNRSQPMRLAVIGFGGPPVALARRFHAGTGGHWHTTHPAIRDSGQQISRSDQRPNHQVDAETRIEDIQSLN